MSRMRWMVGAVAAMVLSSAAAAEDTTKVHWYALRMAGGKVGYCRHTRKVQGDKVTNVETMVLSFARSGVALKISSVDRYVETLKGKPVSFLSVQDLGIMATRVTGTISDTGVVTATVVSGGQPQRRTMQLPEGTLLSEGLALLQKAKGLKPGTKYTAKTFMAGLMQAADADVTIGEKTQVDVLGRVMTLTRVDMVARTGKGEIPTTVYVDDDYVTHKMTMKTMGIDVEMLACDKTFALSESDQVDFFNKLLIKCPTPLEEVTSIKSATYHITPTEAEKLKFPTMDSQSVRNGEGNARIVTVRPLTAPKGHTMPYKGEDPAAKAALKPTRYVQSNAEKIVAAAREAVGSTTDAAKAATKIQDYVRKHINRKNLSVGYASALETLESRQGDCTEHAVLTAALCRASGIPARIVTGVAYASSFRGRKDVFVPHAWTEAYIGGKWIGLDAAMGRYDAGHIALCTGDGASDDFFAMGQLLGYFRITKVDVER